MPLPFCDCGYSTRDSHHKHYHDLWENGEKLKPLASDIVLAQRDDTEVLVVPFGARLEQRKRAERVGWQGNSETHYDFGVYNRYASIPSKVGYPTFNMTAFLARRDGRGIGIAVAQQSTHVATLTWADFDAHIGDGDLFEANHAWMITFVWTHRHQRRRGIGSLLVTSAAEYLKVPLASMAWLLPFKEAVQALARRLAPSMLHIGITET